MQLRVTNVEAMVAEDKCGECGKESKLERKANVEELSE